MTIRLTILFALMVSLAGCGGGEHAERHRKIAEWTIAQGGGVYLDDSSSEIKTKDKLPERDFKIRRLSLNGTKIRDKDLKKLKEMTDLVSLSLHSTKITDKGLAELAPLTSLEELELSNTNITDKGLKKLAELTKLKKLFLNQTAVTDQAIASLKSSLSGCKVIKLQ